MFGQVKGVYGCSNTVTKTENCHGLSQLASNSRRGCHCVGLRMRIDGLGEGAGGVAKPCGDHCDRDALQVRARDAQALLVENVGDRAVETQ